MADGSGYETSERLGLVTMCIILGDDCTISHDGHMLPYHYGSPSRAFALLLLRTQSIFPSAQR